MLNKDLGALIKANLAHYSHEAMKKTGQNNSEKAKYDNVRFLQHNDCYR